jgi:hypothetical protein
MGRAYGVPKEERDLRCTLSPEYFIEKCTAPAGR